MSLLKALLSRIKVAGLIASIILIECLVAYFLIPSAAEVTAMAESRYQKTDDLELADLEEQEEQAQPAENTTEEELGVFSVTAYQPVSNTTLRIDFTLSGTVLNEEVKEFRLRMKQNEKRIREQVNVTIRSSEINDLTDARLGLIKRKILEKTNRTLGRPLLQSVIIPDFSFVEQ